MTPSSADAGASRTSRRPVLSVRHLYLLIPLVVVAWRAAAPLSDNSFLWHVRAGTVQLDGGEVLRSDPFSFTAPGEPWRTQSWLVELGYGWTERLFGNLQWAPTMMFLLMSAALGFIGLAAYRVVRDPLKVAGAVLVTAWIGLSFIVPRPVIVSFLLLAVFVVILGHPHRLGWTLIPLSWLWASVHGLFVVGLALVALEALRRRSWRLMGIGAAAGVATLLTAHGPGVVQILLDFFENREALGFLSEWKRPDFLSVGLFPALLVVVGLAAAFTRGTLSRSYLLVAVPFLVLGALQLRSVFPAVLVLVPGASAATIGRRARPRRGGENHRVNVAIGVTICLIAALALARPLERDTDDLPSAGAVAALSRERVFHGPGAGGLLIWAEYPERKVFVDDRAELYGADFFAAVVDTVSGRSGTALLDRYALDEALVKTSWELDGVLAREGWLETYRDEDWAVYLRP